MNKRQISITLLCLLTTGTGTTAPDVKTFNSIDIELPTIQLVQPAQQKIKKQEPNLLCADSKYLTYTNIDNINLNNFNLNDFYIDTKGYVREQNTNAIYAAMATNYKKKKY